MSESNQRPTSEPRQGQPIRTEDLVRRDQVLLFGRLVEIADVQSVGDFPTTVNLVILPVGGGQPRETLVPRGMLLMGLRVERTIRLRCAGCPSTTPVRVDVAAGVDVQPLCVGCRARSNKPLGPWLTPVRH
ncbi:hypothetical protein [Verrucosispora sp. WMMD1129]|uniref:hypothetical protein n=1 Tax=Verrucosispora sp. WMMD1129 TaxID=3016093 RepID=UPI002499C52B|nr:hypothetical protein [Verrucosispora sp. WMMD1129]WFE47619.1 hypothetical protein O7624_26500 [Verrucosispora sp. WMMD1129]